MIRAASPLQGFSTGASSSMMAIRPKAEQLDFRTIDLDEESKIDHFYSTTCGCLKACIKQFTHEHVKLTRANAAQLSRSDLDMALLGQVVASTPCRQLQQNVIDDPDKHIKRNRNSVIFYHQGTFFCRNNFLFLHTIGEFRFKALKAHYLSQGLVPHTHGHCGRMPQMLWY